MSEMSLLPVPVIQMGLVEKLAEVEQNQPYVQQIVAQESARQALQAQAERVPATDASEHGKKIQNREPGQEKREQRHRREAGDRRDASSGDDDAEDAMAASNPWTGQILNMKV
jgi:hypothetical protein